MRGLGAALALGAGAALALAVCRAWRRQRGRGSQLRSKGGAVWSTAPARVLLVGDSITEFGSAPGGWVSRLQWAYARKADVLNRGFSGYTTRHLAAMLPELLEALGPLPCERTVAVALMLGTNDASVAGAFQHVPAEEYLRNTLALLAALRSAFPNAALLVLSPPAVDGDAWDAHCRRAFGADGGGRSLALAREYAALAERAAALGGGQFVDVLSSMAGPRGGAPYAHLLSDGLHLSAEGNEHLFELVHATLGATSAAPSALPEHFPRDPLRVSELLLAS